jgi:16S rRNA U516 pseudouridylate synthase RsuA-like enzyme
MSDDKRVEVTYNINPAGRTNDSLLNKYDAGVMAEDETDRLVKDSMIRGSRYLGS